MSSGFRDPVGTAGALLVGAAVGLVLVTPVLPAPAALRAPAVGVGPVGGYLLVGVLALTAVPLCVTLLYLVLAEMDG